MTTTGGDPEQLTAKPAQVSIPEQPKRRLRGSHKAAGTDLDSLPENASTAAEPSTKAREGTHSSPMPYFAPLAMLIVTVVIAAADVTFLSDVIGQVLDLRRTESVLLSVVVGLVGLAFMADLGRREAEQRVGKASQWIHLTIWVALGIAIASARLFSAKILDISAADGADLELFGVPIREQDAVFAPIMLLMYVIAGIGAREAVRSLLLNESFHRRLSHREQEKAKLEGEKRAAEQAQRERLEAIKAETDQKRRELLAQRDKARQEKVADAQRQAVLKKERAEALHQEDLKTHAKRQELERERIEREKANLGAVEEAKRLEAEAAEKKKNYENAVRRYSQLRRPFDDQTKKVADLLALLERLDTEIAAVDAATANRTRIIDKSEESMQHRSAFLIHARTKEPVAQLRTIIENFNATRSS